MTKHVALRCCAIGLSIQVGLSMLSHPGALDSNGGHHDRKNGGYHFHGGGSRSSSPPVVRAPPPVLPEPRKQRPPRTEPRVAVTLSPRTAARTEAPRLEAAISGTGQGLGNRDSSKLTHEVAKKQGVLGNVIIRVRLYPPDSTAPSDEEIKKIAIRIATDNRYAVYFYLPGMKIIDPAWSVAIVADGRVEKLTTHGERRPIPFVD